MKTICMIIWELSEWTGIGLGRFAPHIFGGMIGSKPIARAALKEKNDE